MRTYGRLNGVWQVVQTDSKGFDDYVWITTLIQTLLLNLNESPFYASSGIPAHPSIVQQVFPDFYVALTQQRFSQYFANLTVSKRNSPSPVYDISVVTKQGVVVQESIPE